MGLHRRPPIWLHLAACLAHNNTQMTMWEHQITMLEIHRTKTLNSGNPQINFLHHRGIVTRLRSLHFQALPSSTTMPHSTWYQAHNQALEQPKDMRVMGHHSKDTISPKEVMVDHTCSPFSNSPDRGRHLQVHLECLQHCVETFQSFRRPLPLLLHTGNVQAHQGDPPLASQRNDFSRQRNRTGQMLQGLRTCPHYQRFLMTNSIQIMRAMIRPTSVVLKAKPQSAWSNQNSPWSNLPKRWGCATLVHSTSGRKYGWLGFSRRSIGPLSRDRTVWNISVMDPCTGRQRLQLVWRVLRSGCPWKTLIMRNGFGDNGLQCFWRNVQARFCMRGRWEGEATCDPRRIWESAQAKKREVTSKSYHIQHSWLWFIECRTATMSQHPACKSKLPKEPYYLTALYKCNLTKEELDEEYMGFSTPGQMMKDPWCGQISYNSSLSNAFKLKLGHDVQLLLIEMKAATGKDFAEHVVRPAKVIPASLVTVSYAHS